MKYNFTYSLMTSKYGFLPYKGTRLSCIGKFYLPQTKFPKVVFLHLSVSHSVHRGVSRPTPKARPTPWGVSQHALRQTSPPRMATAAGGTHPTGIHASSFYFGTIMASFEHVILCLPCCDNVIATRMHSSRMCTACLLTISQHALVRGICLGVYLPGGVPAQGGVSAQGCTCPGAVPAQGVYLHQGVYLSGGVYLPRGYLPRYSPSCEQND